MGYTTEATLVQSLIKEAHGILFIVTCMLWDILDLWCLCLIDKIDAWAVADFYCWDLECHLLVWLLDEVVYEAYAEGCDSKGSDCASAAKHGIWFVGGGLSNGEDAGAGAI